MANYSEADYIKLHRAELLQKLKDKKWYGKNIPSTQKKTVRDIQEEQKAKSMAKEAHNTSKKKYKTRRAKSRDTKLDERFYFSEPLSPEEIEEYMEELLYEEELSKEENKILVDFLDEDCEYLKRETRESLREQRRFERIQHRIRWGMILGKK